jgi:hypothetical protein
MKPKFSIWRSSLLLSLIASSAQSAVLGFWDFEANPGVGPNYVQAGTPITGVTASSLTAGSGFADGNYGTSQAVVGVSGSRAYVFAAANLGTSADTALVGGGRGSGPDTFTFTLSPANGYTLELGQLSLYAWGNGNFTSGTYNFFLLSNLTGNTVLGSQTISAEEGITSIGNSISPTEGNNQYTMDLSGIPQFTNITSEVTFTIGVYRSSGTQGNLRFDNFQIDGTVIPEPSGLLLGGLGISALLLRRRKSDTVRR